MAQGHHDSSFDIVLTPLGDGGTGGTSFRLPVREIPMLDLDSSDPLPSDLPEQALATVPTPPAADVAGFDGSAGAQGRAPGSIWLEGDVLLCACPDCSAPMSVRLWLMIADCWNCGTSIELSEEQEREAMRLLQQREQAKRRQTTAAANRPADRSASAKSANGKSSSTASPAAGGAKSRDTTKQEARARTQPAAPSESPRRDSDQRNKSPQQQRQRKTDTDRQGRRSAAQRPVGVRAKIRKMAVVGTVRVWVHDFFRNMPAWLISMVFHLVLLTILGLLMLDDDRKEPEILLATEISTERREGGDPEAQLARDEIKFDLPVPDKDLPKNEAQRKAILAADQDARTLRIDPEAPAPQLPPLPRMKQLLHSSDTVRRTFAARDPRLRVEMVKAEGGTTLTEAAVARALRWLALNQEKDGGWGLRRGRSDAAGTSLALLPFLGAGQTHQSGIYKDNVSFGLRWMLDHQTPDGDLRHSYKGQNPGMYAHGQGTIVLCEAFALTGDEHLRDAAQKAIDFIVKAQLRGGGWRYKAHVDSSYRASEEGDTSVLGWQLMALHSARVAGLNVPDTTLELAGQFLDTVQSHSGARYKYQRARDPSETMTAEGLLCRIYTGWTKRNPGLSDGLDWLMTDHMPNKRSQNIYYWYYGTQVAHHLGGKQWTRWNMNMRDILVESQEREGPNAGSWRPAGGHASSGGRVYVTSLAACSLEVYYRHTPIFRKIELDE